MAAAHSPRSKKSAPKTAAAKPAGQAKPPRAKATKDPRGGLTAAGRAKFAATEGAHLRPGVTGAADTPQKKVRKGSFLRRHFANPQGPMEKDGKPTRLALSAHAWGEPVPHWPGVRSDDRATHQTEPDMAAKAKYDKPELRDRIKAEVMKGDKGGRPGQWSARKAQLVAHEYEAAGGGYVGPPAETQQHLQRWTDEHWQTADAKPAIAGKTTHRYLPKKAWDQLTPAEQKKTDAKKVSASKRGQQFVANTPAAKKARKAATGDKPKAAPRKPPTATGAKPAPAKTPARRKATRRAK